MSTLSALTMAVIGSLALRPRRASKLIIFKIIADKHVIFSFIVVLLLFYDEIRQKSSVGNSLSVLWLMSNKGGLA